MKPDYQIKIRVNIWIICFAAICFTTALTKAKTGETVEDLFSTAMQVCGQEYVELRGQILAVAEPNDAYLGKMAQSDDLKTRIIAQALLERIQDPQKYRHFEELMIVPIIISVTQGETSVIGARPYETLKAITSNQTNKKPLDNNRINDPRANTPPDHGDMSQYHSQGYCHGDTAYYFLAEIALKGSMTSLPTLADSIPLADENKIYTIDDVAEILGVMPSTVEIWHEHGVLTNQNDIYNRNADGKLSHKNIIAFYNRFCGKRPNPFINQEFPNSAQEYLGRTAKSLISYYAVLMLRNFNIDNSSELFYEIYKTEKSEMTRAFCVEQFSAKNQIAEIQEAMKATKTVPAIDDPRAAVHSEGINNSPLSNTKEVPDKQVRKAAIIKSMENPEAFNSEYYPVLISDIDYKTNMLIAETLGKNGDPNNLEILTNILRHNRNSNDAYQTIIKAIIEIDPNYIYKLLENENNEIRDIVWTSLAFSNIHFPLELDYLREQLNDPKMIYKTISLIAKYHPEELPGFLDHPNPEVRIRTVEQLANASTKIDKSSIKDTLLDHIKDQDAEIRESILCALRKYNSDETVQTILTNALNDEEPKCRLAALHSLDRDRLSITTLDNLLKNEKDENIRRSAIYCLSDINGDEKYQMLMKYIQDESPELRTIIAEYLGYWKNKQAIKPLTQMLNDRDEQVRFAAVKSIAHTDIKTLEDIIQDLKPDMRRVAYYCLSEEYFNYPEDIVGLLTNGTKDPDATVRASALSALSRSEKKYDNNHPAVQAVKTNLSDPDPKVRENAIYALYKMIDNNSISHIAKMLNDSDLSIRETAISILGQTKNKASISPLIELLKKEQDSNLQYDITLALENITGNILTKEQWLQWWNENKGE